jgi:hypothetical protein
MRIFNNLKLKFSLKSRAINKVNFNYKEKDSWALITGCTSGIGKAYAEFLFQNNFNLILISISNKNITNLLLD